MSETIDHSTLSRLAEAGAIQGAHIVGQPGGWTLLVRYGTHERPLAAQRSRNIRLFRRFETLVAYLQEIGIARFEVDASGYAPDVTRRPDRSEALKRTHEAAAYAEWFREQVQASIDDSRPSLSDDEVRAHFSARRAALRNNP